MEICFSPLTEAREGRAVPCSNFTAGIPLKQIFVAPPTGAMDLAEVWSPFFELRIEPIGGAGTLQRPYRVSAYTPIAIMRNSTERALALTQGLIVDGRVEAKWLGLFAGSVEDRTRFVRDLLNSNGTGHYFLDRWVLWGSYKTVLEVNPAPKVSLRLSPRTADAVASHEGVDALLRALLGVVARNLTSLRRLAIDPNRFVGIDAVSVAHFLMQIYVPEFLEQGDYVVEADLLGLPELEGARWKRLFYHRILREYAPPGAERKWLVPGFLADWLGDADVRLSNGTQAAPPDARVISTSGKTVMWLVLQPRPVEGGVTVLLETHSAPRFSPRGLGAVLPSVGG